MSFTHRLITRAMQFTPSGGDLKATRVFVLDALGTGLSGTHISYAKVLAEQALGWHGSGVATLIGHKQRLSRDGAALVNGYLIHNQEYDCVHERAIVHPMGVILGVLLAHGDVEQLTGAELVDGVACGVEVAISIGLVARTPLKFYRQGMTAALGATAALAKQRGLDADGVTSAMGLCYSQLSGTMQAHAEGSPMLPMQMGFNARAVLNAVDLALAGVPGPKEFLEGRYGYFNLMEIAWNQSDAEAALEGGHWIQELSHKPFPTGRATHAVIDALSELKARHDFDCADVVGIDVAGPPLVVQLGGRPVEEGMAPNYARLCLGYVAASALMEDGVEPRDFFPDRLADGSRLELARKLRLSVDGNPDENALAPVTVTVELRGGQQHTQTIVIMRGHPQNPLTWEAYMHKFRRSVASAAKPLEPEQLDTLVANVQILETLPDTKLLTELLVP
jgi:aconitate decarboxylase